jgi:hypothetical protein
VTYELVVLSIKSFIISGWDLIQLVGFQNLFFVWFYLFKIKQSSELVGLQCELNWYNSPLKLLILLNIC